MRRHGIAHTLDAEAATSGQCRMGPASVNMGTDTTDNDHVHVVLKVQHKLNPGVVILL